MPDGKALPIIQQPAGRYEWVSNVDDVLTQHGGAREIFGTSYFLAHNYRAGDHILELEIDDVIEYRQDVGTKYYKVIEIKKYQSLSPYSYESMMRNLETHETKSARSVMIEMSSNNQNIIFQTCINKYGLNTWGRVFVIAEPI